MYESPGLKQMSDSEYMAQALSAAPEAVAKGAAVVRMQKNESMRTLRKGDNGFTCMIDGKGKGMCNDTVAMEFIDGRPPRTSSAFTLFDVERAGG
jgi:predicted lipoprotein with Yx(FWY)xxD motif